MPRRYLGGAGLLIVPTSLSNPYLAVAAIGLVELLQRPRLARRLDACMDVGGRTSVATLCATNMMGNVGGFVSPIVTGYVVERTGNWTGVLRGGRRLRRRRLLLARHRPGHAARGAGGKGAGMSTVGDVFDSGTPDIYEVETRAPGPAGRLPLTEDLLRHSPSGDAFGMSQDAGMGWEPSDPADRQYVILSTLGGLRATTMARRSPSGYHTGHWEVGLAVRAAAEEVRRLGGVPYAGDCSDPATAAPRHARHVRQPRLSQRRGLGLRRLARSIPNARGVMGVATCDKGLPAMMMALAGLRRLPVRDRAGRGDASADARGGRRDDPDDGRALRAGRITLEEAAESGCRACARPVVACQFLGTAATLQVVGEALGMVLPHSALAPSGQPIWLDMARRSARALVAL